MKTFPLDEFVFWVYRSVENLGMDEDGLTKTGFLHAVAEALEAVGSGDCAVCSVDCYEIREYYMVTNEIWDQFGAVHGMLCIGCLENLMGRELVKTDFTDAPVNDDRVSSKSERFASRMLA